MDITRDDMARWPSETRVLWDMLLEDGWWPEALDAALPDASEVGSYRLDLDGQFYMWRDEWERDPNGFQYTGESKDPIGGDWPRPVDLDTLDLTQHLLPVADYPNIWPEQMRAPVGYNYDGTYSVPVEIVSRHELQRRYERQREADARTAGGVDRGGGNVTTYRDTGAGLVEIVPMRRGTRHGDRWNAPQSKPPRTPERFTQRRLDGRRRR
jgi:hypothetical protein